MQPEDTLKATQAKVAELLGRCMLNLQLCELGMKFINANHGFAGAPEQLEAAIKQKTAAQITMGSLVKGLFGSYFTTNGSHPPKHDHPDEGNYISFRAGCEISEEDYSKLEREMKDLVSLRNSLVHHFAQDHDLQTIDGCHKACIALNDANHAIKTRLQEIRQFCRELIDIREIVLKILPNADVIE